jgi:hypothetical protein
MAARAKQRDKVRIETVCCVQMGQQLAITCPHHKSRHDCPDVLIVKSSGSITGFGLSIKDGGASSIEFYFCPFCGTDLRTGLS